MLSVVTLPTSLSYLYSHFQQYDVNAEVELGGGLWRDAVQLLTKYFACQQPCRGAELTHLQLLSHPVSCIRPLSIRSDVS